MNWGRNRLHSHLLPGAFHFRCKRRRRIRRGRRIARPQDRSTKRGGGRRDIDGEVLRVGDWGCRIFRRRIDEGDRDLGSTQSWYGAPRWRERWNLCEEQQGEANGPGVEFGFALEFQPQPGVRPPALTQISLKINPPTIFEYKLSHSSLLSPFTLNQAELPVCDIWEG